MPENIRPVLPNPIAITHCAVCDKPFAINHLAFYGDEEDMLANETCDNCFRWFHLETFALNIMLGRAWAPIAAEA